MLLVSIIAFNYGFHANTRVCVVEHKIYEALTQPHLSIAINAIS